MQPMEYKDERSADLRLRLFRGPVDLEAFPVLVRRTRPIAGLVVDACIIGASHAVQFRAGEEIVTEVLACRTKAVERFEDERSGVWRLGEDVRAPLGAHIGYSFESEVAPLLAADRALAELRSLVREADARGSIGLAFRFPSIGVERPETLLHVSEQEGRLAVRSAHVYPQEGAAVLSRTVLDIRPAELESAPATQLLEVGTR